MSKKKPAVSIILPTYNRASFVTKAIESVLDQTFDDYDIIVIDDGSTDNTCEVLEPYRDKIQYIHTNNSGVSAARNAGIQLAKGGWIAFLDSDDEWLPDYLSLQMQQVRQNPKICTHMTNSINISANGMKENNFQVNKSLAKFKKKSCIMIERPLHFVIKYHTTVLPSTIMKRETLLKAGLFDERLTITEDLDLIARMALQGPFGICKNELVYIYRRKESLINLSEQIRNEGIYSCESFAIVYKKLRTNEMLLSNEKRLLDRVLSSERRALANLLLRYGKKTDAKSYYKEALFICPSIASFIKYLLSFLPAKVALWFVKKGWYVELGKGV